MAIHTRRPQDPSNMPKITIGSGPTPPTPPEPAPGQETRAALAAAAAASGAAAGSASTLGGQDRVRAPRSWLERNAWLVALVGSLVPMIAALLVEPSAMFVLLGVAGVLIIAGVVLYFKRT
jgi:hypothetical protein